MQDANKRNDQLQGAWGLIFLELPPTIVITNMSFCPLGYYPLAVPNSAPNDSITVRKAKVRQVRSLM